MTLSSRQKLLFLKIIPWWHLFLLCSYFRAHPDNTTSGRMHGPSPPQILGRPSPLAPRSPPIKAVILLLQIVQFKSYALARPLVSLGSQPIAIYLITELVFATFTMFNELLGSVASSRETNISKVDRTLRTREDRIFRMSCTSIKPYHGLLT